ncbi:MAG: phosphoenolpyruvate--protein phosphotransferase [Gammaproteobacteria bacterium]
MLELLRRTIQEVNAAPDLSAALRIVVDCIKRSMHVDVCSIYLTNDETQQNVLMATDGYSIEAVGQVYMALSEGLVGLVTRREEPVNLDDAASHPDYVLTREIGEEPYHGFLGVPVIQHRKVLGVLVVRQKQRRCFDEEEETFLVTLAAQLAGAIIHAESTGQINRLVEDSSSLSYSLVGLSGVPGAAVGQVRVVFPLTDIDAIPDRAVTEVESEIAKFTAAVMAVEQDMLAMSERMKSSLSSEDIALFDALIMMLKSENLVNGTIDRIREGNWAQGALRGTIVEHVQAFEAMEDPYLSERASDVRDLGRRVLQRLQSISPVQAEYYEQTILVGDEVSAAQLAEVPLGKLAGIVCKRGSSASHVSILARALGVPAVMGVEGLQVSRLEAQETVVDGYSSRIFIRPSRAIRDEYLRLVREENELNDGLVALTHEPAVTPDGFPVTLYANTGLFSDISPSLRSGAEGVGLYRTEIPFLIRDRFPSEEEQRRICRQVLAAFAPRPVTVRTLDIGGDKLLPYFPVEEQNPFLGWRGIRISLDHPEIFLTQIRAIMRASVGLNNLRLLLPMISGVSEIDAALVLIRRAFDELLEAGETVEYPQIGVMIEVPSALYQIEAMAKRVDFFSIGSNDLTQYLLAVDRNNASVAELYETVHPAVLRAIQSVVSEANRLKKPVSVCGEMAGDPAAALLLLAMGVDSLSMSSINLLRVKWVIRTFSCPQARQLLMQALALETPEDVRSILHVALEEKGLGGLVRAGR